MHSKVPEPIRRLIRQRANYLCEYCHASEKWQYVRFTVDHIIPMKRGGLGISDNLALACFHCNRRKGDHVTAEDPVSGMEVRLFNPRQDAWAEHFVWSTDGLRIVGRTPTGRATITALEMNRSWAVSIRAADRVVGRHPPVDDPIE
ncbi:MAG: HNH endonuclease signature motif containing protein [Chloroflexi bacterium]|nr:HNH endonuclease signature motif containing protein [Chloroflexota bacterium]